MEKNKILGSQDNTKIIRILEVKESSFLVIDCIKRTMPQWKDKEQFKDWKSVTEQELWEITNIYPSKTDTALSTTSKYIQEHYALIAGILTFIGDEKERSRMIRSIAELKNYSKQTIRNTLCLYLVYQDISVLAPKEKKEKELSRDEKIMRWSLNKFFYTKNQNTLTTAYTMMLKEKYTDAEGTLLSHPSIHQFRYFYKKTKKQQNFYISREGVKKYQRNRRPLLGQGVQEFASSIGMAMLDSTICDIYLVNKEVVEVLWQILGAIIRQNVPWGKSAWFYSESGNNGKGTLCELMRQLCGEGSYKSIKLEDMGKEFLLEPLVGASAIIVDENDVGTYIDKAANLKAIVTGDVIQINRKFKQPISFRFRGFMVQCLNEMPRVKDKSDSFFRRQLFIPFTKCFTGAERKYIKQDYLKRTEVLEYVLYKVLNMNYYELSTPDVCKDALEEYKEFNDPILQFVNEILPQLQWDLVPFTFLYSLYRAWFDRYIPSGSPQARNTFIKDLLIALKSNDTWECKDKNAKVASANRMDKPEWLIDEYKLEDWYNQTYKGNDRAKRCCPSLQASYRGIVRK